MPAQKKSTQSKKVQSKSSQNKSAKKGKKLNKTKLGKTVAVLFFTAAIAILSLQWVEQERILNRQQERIAQMQQQYDQIAAQIADYNRMIQLSESPSYIEHYLREKLGMIKENEVMYKVEISP